MDLGSFLREVSSLLIPAKRYYKDFVKELNNDGFLYDVMTENHVRNFFTNLEEIINNHNSYLNSLNSYTLSKVINNSTMTNMYRVSRDPSNLMQAHTSVDATTGPLKDVANTSSEAAEASTRTAGNAVNKFESIVENLTGKEGISICATGLKSYFGLTQYCNWVLNNGTVEEQLRLLLGSDHKGITIGGKTYKTLANIRAINLNTVRNSELFTALSEVTLDEDIALTLSALLSLATDNAKELALSKLNAGTKMLGMYIYGLSIGMKFLDIADILMSPVGNVLKNMLDDDKFAKRDAFGSVSDGVFKYFTEGPYRLLLKFDIFQDSLGNKVGNSPVVTLQKALAEKLAIKSKNGKSPLLTSILLELALDNSILKEKIKVLEDLRNKYRSLSLEAKEVYNQLIDFVEDYIQQADIIWKHENTFKDIIKLSKGALELKILGLILGLNLGIKTSQSDFLNQINNLRRAIYNTTKNLEDIVDLVKFALDENTYFDGNTEYPTYREYVISKYEEVKEAFNIFDVVTKVPHFMGYLLTLGTAFLEVNNAFTFRSTDTLLLPIKNKLGEYVKEDKLANGIANFCSSWLLNHWMLDTREPITIPKDNLAFDRNGNLYPLEEDTTILLGTPHGNATFRLWMENEVIPNLKDGFIEPGKLWSKISNNKFIKDLGSNLLSKTVSKNTTVVLALPINMLPTIDSERSLLNEYRSQFNELALPYRYLLTTYSIDSEGNSIENHSLSKPILITDLFTYYAMIANNWKLDLSSLVPITEDFQNRGIIKEFHDYISDIDKSEFTLNEENILFEELLPYVAPSESPYTSSAEIIWARNPKSQKRELMEKLSAKEAREARLEGSSDVFGRYRTQGSINNLNFFPAGQVGGYNLIATYVNISNELREVKVLYDENTQEIKELKILNLDILEDADPMLKERLLAIKQVPMTKINKARVPDITLIQQLLNHALNPCS